MEKLYALTTFLKMAGGRMHTSHPIRLDSPVAISYVNQQKSRAYFSHSVVGTISFVFFAKRQSQKGGRGHGTMAPF